MYNLIFDADSLIKLAHSRALIKICETFNCITTNDVKRETVEGYVRTLGDARLIVADMGNLWTAKAYENRSEAMHKQQEAEEEMMMQKARVARTSPLEAYDTESRD